MRIIAIMPVRNEEWCLGLTARALLMWVDQLIILDHASTDRTRDIMMDLTRDPKNANRLVFLSEPDPTWREMAHRQMLLEMARRQGATHVVTVDADEVLTGNLLPTIREKIGALPQNAVMQLPWVCLRDSIYQQHATGVWSQQYASVAFCDDPRWYWSSSERGGYDFHHRHPMGRNFIPQQAVHFPGGGLFHLQFVSKRRLHAKQLHYQLIERLRWPDRESVETVVRKYRYSVYGWPNRPEGGIPHFDLKAVPTGWWEPYSHLVHHLNPDLPAWQEPEIARMLRENPGLGKDLDDFGSGLLSLPASGAKEVAA
ncbi:MAG TPA: glycosyltransferase family 2 protein [Bryobacteraceae bacterium]|nr:glycosyltransferase family 2 protein [Bryobacteraceae bacterium]